MTRSTCAVVVTYNGENHIKKCLESLLINLNPQDIIVVDNSSTDSTVSIIRSCYSNVELICCSSNLGFSRANNIGISMAMRNGYKHIFMMNQDCYVIGSCIECLEIAQERMMDCGIISPVHLKPDTNFMDEGFKTYISKSKNIIDGCYLQVPFINAAAWMVSSRCIEKSGKLSNLFFFRGEDNNYCQRVIFHGFYIAVLNNCFIVHNRICCSAFSYKEKKDDMDLIYKVEMLNILNRNLFYGFLSGLKKSFLISWQCIKAGKYGAPFQAVKASISNLCEFDIYIKERKKFKKH